MSRPHGLPPKLKALVRRVGAILGRVAREAEGPALYRVVEGARRLMVRLRGAGPEEKARLLARAGRLVAGLPPTRREPFARAYTLYLELVNACENAYRSHRLREIFKAGGAGPKARLTLVLTSHPTESRSPENIRVLRRLQDAMVRALQEGGGLAEVEGLVRLLWRVRPFPDHKPRLEDEARHLYSLLDGPIVSELLSLRAEGHAVALRTWVGGDKDGHPGVGPRQLLASLRLAREKLAAHLERLLLRALEDAALLGEAGLLAALARARARLRACSPLREGDGARLRGLGAALGEADLLYRRSAGARHPALAEAAGLLELFPGLVVPLELREAAGSFGAGGPIRRMMRLVGRVARGGEALWYARGLVVSMAESPRDVLEAFRAARASLGSAFPVIPLFESPEALSGAGRIMDGCWDDAAFRGSLRRRGGLEVMLGYSDSAKRAGALASRLAIHDAMRALSRWARRRRLDLLFFHGAGGSEGRGGGTIEEQAATWPPGSLGLVKLTVQGEMAERVLSTPEILRSSVRHVAAVQDSPPARRGPSALARELARRSRVEFEDLVAEPAFHRLMCRATPYSRLGSLAIGSRPSQRAGGAAGPAALRAIPWVLCWTQVRLPLPAWYGAGTAWKALRAAGVAPEALRRAAAEDPLLRSYLRLLGFALLKAEPAVWREYARRLHPGAAPGLLARLESDRLWAARLVRDAAGGRGALWDRPWLKQSVFYRAPMIHPLNLLQIQVLAKPRLDRADEALLRETVTGIAAGMLTTG